VLELGADQSPTTSILIRWSDVLTVVDCEDKRHLKMLKDEKNTEYLDQIYYALAEVALKAKQDSLGVDYLRKSVQTSVSNNYQKTTSALRLANIYFAMPDYENAQSYYDSTMQFLPADYPGYDELVKRTANLTNLVTNLQVYTTEDSLQRLAALPEYERNTIIDRVIKEILEKERLAAEEASRRSQELAFLGQNSREQEQQAGGNWYFYNPSAISFGFTEFVKRWGRRKLEDNWRLRNKQVTSFDSDMEEQSDSLVADSANMVYTDPKDRKTYMQNIPLTEEKMKESNIKLAEALNNLGSIYRDGLEDYPKSAGSFETLIQRFPNDSTYELSTYYALYKLFALMNNMERSDYYKDLILKKYTKAIFYQGPADLKKPLPDINIREGING